METTEEAQTADKLIPADQLEDFEELFLQEGRDLLIKRLRVGLAVGVVLYVAFALLDMIAVSDELFPTILTIRLLAVILPICVIPMSFTAFGKRYIRSISMGIMYIGSASMIAMTWFLGGFASEYFMGIMLATFLVGLFFPWGVRLTAWYSLAVMGTYVATNLTADVVPMEKAILPIFFLGGTCVLTCWASGAVEASRREALRMRMQLEVANESLKELDKAKTGFFANVSHELRTPLMLILGPLESMLRGESGDPQPLLKAMNANAHRLLRQVNMILNFSKIRSILNVTRFQQV